MKSLVFHPAAEVEVERAAEFYEERRTGLGSALRRELEESLRFISRNPGLLPRFETTNFRFHVLRRFPYVLFFEESIDGVSILAFAHG